MGRLVIADRNGLLTKSATQLTEICYCHMIECPKQIFIKGNWSFLNTNFDAVHKKPILSIQVLRLDSTKQGWVVLLKNKHSFPSEERLMPPLRLVSNSYPRSCALSNLFGDS